MFNLNYKPAISINLDNGVYLFDNQSATGKTRLCRLLKSCQSYYEPVAAYTYSDFTVGFEISKVLNPKYKVVLLDRYDMYNGVGGDLINKYKNDMIILIDCKSDFTVTNDDELCVVNLYSDRIEVYG